MLLNPTLEKLRALRLTGLVQALEEQRQQNDLVSLSFEGRLALLVERQWLWQENRGLAIRLKNAQATRRDAGRTGRTFQAAHLYHGSVAGSAGLEL